MKTIPYTYLIGWKKLDKWYYGVRYANSCRPEEFWVKYFTSSRYVADIRREYGEPDVVEVRKVFETKHAARVWEEKVLRRLDAVKSPKWINRCNNGSQWNSDGLIGRKVPEETLKKRAIAQKGIKRTPEQRFQQSLRTKGITKHSPEAIERNRVAQTGKKLSDSHIKNIREGLDRRNPEYREKISQARKGIRKTEEHRKKISAGHQNRTPEYREKLRQAALKRWAHKYIQPT